MQIPYLHKFAYANTYAYALACVCLCLPVCLQENSAADEF